ncbi:MAG: hypothetical protein HQL76_08470 [Magnetococcales bacterium]|nr:hypothetical protein [Magnetococcales bacterium]
MDLQCSVSGLEKCAENTGSTSFLDSPVLVAVLLFCVVFAYLYIRMIPRARPILIILLFPSLLLAAGTYIDLLYNLWNISGLELNQVIKHFKNNSWHVILPLFILLLWLVGKLVLVRRYARLGKVIYPRHGNSDVRLLPSQEVFLDRIDNILRQEHVGVGRIIAISGQWGSGKSFLMEQIRHRIEKKTSPIAVWIDIWRHETEEDLQRAVLERLMAHPRGLKNWKSFPLTLLIPKWLYNNRFRLSIKDVSVDVQSGIRLPWQSDLERLLAATPAVFMFDEIDRATPTMAQAALTLIRRSLNLKGVTCIVSYVEEQIFYKAFNPLLDHQLEDIQSSMYAVLLNERLKNGPPDEDPKNEAACKELTSNIFRSSAPTGAHDTKPETGKEEDKGGHSKMNGLFQTLDEHYAEILCRGGNRLERLHHAFYEKYLSERMEVPSLNYSDLSAFVDTIPDLNAIAKKFSPHYKQQWLEPDDMFKALFKKSGRNIHHIQSRTLKGELFRFLSLMSDSVPPSEKEARRLFRATVRLSISRAAMLGRANS